MFTSSFIRRGVSLTKRKFVFEEVDNRPAEIRKLSETIAPTYSQLPNNHAVTWLSLLLVMIVFMVVVGGMTRLTDSGLSIVEWKPISGMLLPLTSEQWQLEFTKYKGIPEFLLVNSDMTIEEFKYIYFWEWGHRQLGRAIGLAWFLGFAWLGLKGRIPKGWKLKFFSIGILIGLQGFIGWWMVYSGLLPGMTDVASYRLAVHLGMAFCLAGLVLWFILSLRLNFEAAMISRRNRDDKLYFWMKIYLIALFIQIILGALVAGIDAGTAYTDWPWMAGHFFPSDYWNFDGAFANVFENPANVQFNHRISAYALLVIGVLVFIYSRKSPIRFLKKCHTALLFLLSAQVLIGIVTVIHGAPYQIAIIHQLMAMILWLSVIWTCFETAFPRRQALT